LTEGELTLLAAVAPLVETPRSATRLLNLYRMLRSTRDLSRSSRFLGSERLPGEYQAVVVLLGMLTAHPLLLGRVLMEPPEQPRRGEQSRQGGILYWNRDRRWADVVAAMTPEPNADGNKIGVIPAAERADWAHLVDGLRDTTPLVKLSDLRAFQLWGPRITRFSFVLSPLAAAGSPWTRSPMASIE